MATFSLSINGELDELAQIAQRLAGFQPAPIAGETALVGALAATDVAPAAPPAEPAKRTRKAKEDVAPAVPTQTADAASPADTSASSTEASSSTGSAPAVSPAPENMTHPDQLVGSAVTPDMLKDAMTDALSKRLIPAAKVQGALKEATGGLPSLSKLWELPDGADRAAKAQAAYAALIALQA